MALGLRALSEQFVAEDNRYTIGGYTTLDAMLSYEVRRLRLRLNLRNLTGTEYETRGFGSVSAIPARPFEASPAPRAGVRPALTRPQAATNPARVVVEREG